MNQALRETEGKAEQGEKKRCSVFFPLDVLYTFKYISLLQLNIATLPSHPYSFDGLIFGKLGS